MQWIIAASSSNIEKFRYDQEAMLLEIEFKKGTIYQYFDVPLSTYEAFLGEVNSGSSAGKFFNENIKGYYRYSRI